MLKLKFSKLKSYVASMEHTRMSTLLDTISHDIITKPAIARSIFVTHFGYIKVELVTRLLPQMKLWAAED